MSRKRPNPHLIDDDLDDLNVVGPIEGRCPRCRGKGIIGERDEIRPMVKRPIHDDGYCATPYPVNQTCPVCNGTGNYPPI